MSTDEKTPEKNYYRFDPEKIDWDTLSQIGLSREQLEKYNLLDPMLKGYKTNQLIPIHLDLGIAVTKMDARLSLQEQPDGSVVIAMHGIRKEPNFRMPLFEHEFTNQDKENLLKSGNMGRVVDLVNPKSGEIIPSIISLDHLTNDLVALGISRIQLPEQVKGVALTQEHQDTLLQGKAIYLEGMISKKGTTFNSLVQYNADKRSLQFIFDRNLAKDQSQQNTVNQKVPASFRGVELTDSQQQRLNEGQSLKIDTLIDKKGQPYAGYISYNKQSSKIEFSFEKPTIQTSENHAEHKATAKPEQRSSKQSKPSSKAKSVIMPAEQKQDSPKIASKPKARKL